MFWLLWAMMSVYWTNGINLITIVYLPSQFYNLLIHIWFISWTKGYPNYKLEIQVSGKLRNYILLTKSNNYFCKLGTQIKQSIHFNILIHINKTYLDPMRIWTFNLLICSQTQYSLSHRTLFLNAKFCVAIKSCSDKITWKCKYPWVHLYWYLYCPVISTLQFLINLNCLHV